MELVELDSVEPELRLELESEDGELGVDGLLAVDAELGDSLDKELGED